MQHVNKHRLIGLLLLSLSLAGCAALQPPDPSGPRSNAPAYPIVIGADESRREEAAIAWRKLAPNYAAGDSAALDLQPGTSTLKELPPGFTPVLPKLGDAATPTEEDFRAALRRFIIEWQPLIGAEPAQLSLIDRVDEPSGVKVARYEQRPFRYPLRGGYGELIVRFRADRQIVGLSSSCLPNIDRIQPNISSLTPAVGAEEVATLLRNGPQTIPGNQQTFTFTANQNLEAKQLVIYAVTSPGAGIELHLCWEIDVTNASIKTIYLDAITGKPVAVT